MCLGVDVDVAVDVDVDVVVVVDVDVDVDVAFDVDLLRIGSAAKSRIQAGDKREACLSEASLRPSP